MLSFIDSYLMQDYGEASHALQRKEKFGFKIRIGKIKGYLTFTVFPFFKLLWKFNLVISYKIHKICYFSDKKN